VGRGPRARLCRVFWRKRKAEQERSAPAGNRPPSRPPSTPPRAAPESDHSTQFLTGDSDVDRRTVEVLLRIIARVSESRDLDPLLTDIVDYSVELTEAERGFLILMDGDGQPYIRVARGPDKRDVKEDLRFSRSIVRGVLDTQEPKLATVQNDADALELSRSVYDLKIRAAMCVPLSASSAGADPAAGPEKVRGVLYVDSRVATREFDHRDLGLFAALSQHISIALENARLHLDSLEKTRLENSLELARAIQSGLMPPVPRDVLGIDVHGWYRPAEKTSGDFFDFVRTRDGRLAVVVGDVTGHGIGPALITASAQASLRSYLRIVPDLAGSVTLLDQDLSERMEEGLFLTLLVAAVDDQGKLEVVNAGHEPPLVWRRGEFLGPHGQSGVALGMLPELPHESSGTVQLESGDLVVAYSDGLVEAHPAGDRDKLFGLERVRSLVSEMGARNASAEEVTLGLAEAALAFSTGGQEDDITLVVIRKL
jgi:sigma-B regulation protein RsbU (phosphoserine phosphatase)